MLGGSYQRSQSTAAYKNLLADKFLFFLGGILIIWDRLFGGYQVQLFSKSNLFSIVLPAISFVIVSNCYCTLRNHASIYIHSIIWSAKRVKNFLCSCCRHKQLLFLKESLRDDCNLFQATRDSSVSNNEQFVWKIVKSSR